MLKFACKDLEIWKGVMGKTNMFVGEFSLPHGRLFGCGRFQIFRPFCGSLPQDAGQLTDMIFTGNSERCSAERPSALERFPKFVLWV